MTPTAIWISVGVIVVSSLLVKRIRSRRNCRINNEIEDLIGTQIFDCTRCLYSKHHTHCADCTMHLIQPN